MRVKDDKSGQIGAGMRQSNMYEIPSGIVLQRTVSKRTKKRRKISDPDLGRRVGKVEEKLGSLMTGKVHW